MCLLGVGLLFACSEPEALYYLDVTGHQPKLGNPGCYFSVPVESSREWIGSEVGESIGVQFDFGVHLTNPRFVSPKGCEAENLCMVIPRLGRVYPEMKNMNVSPGWTIPPSSLRDENRRPQRTAELHLTLRIRHGRFELVAIEPIRDDEPH